MPTVRRFLKDQYGDATLEIPSFVCCLDGHRRVRLQSYESDRRRCGSAHKCADTDDHAE